MSDHDAEITSGRKIFSALQDLNRLPCEEHPPSDPVSVVGRLLAMRRGYTDAGSVQARVECRFSAVAYQSVVHRRGGQWRGLK